MSKSSMLSFLFLFWFLVIWHCLLTCPVIFGTCEKYCLKITEAQEDVIFCKRGFLLLSSPRQSGGWISQNEGCLNWVELLFRQRSVNLWPPFLKCSLLLWVFSWEAKVFYRVCSHWRSWIWSIFSAGNCSDFQRLW